MDANALRIWGIGVSGALMAGAIVLSLQPSPRAQAQPAFQETSETAPAAAHISFLVSFRGAGPIARAQVRARRGRIDEAEQDIRRQLRRQTDFRGLCFDRFTAGAAEVVLRTCAAIVASERDAMQQQWLAQLRAMRGVAYVDVNATAQPGRTD
jgi:hypothetical protein